MGHRTSGMKWERERFIEMEGKEVDRKNDVDRKGIFFLRLGRKGRRRRPSLE